jgi:hypothetical protein
MRSDLYELTVEDREEYLYVCVTAPFMSLEIAVNYSNELMSHLRKTGYTKVLFVRETEGMDSEAHYKIVASLIANMMPPHIILAVVDRSASHGLVKQCLLAERKAKNRNINAFSKFVEAEAWLLNEPSEIHAADLAVID